MSCAFDLTASSELPAVAPSERRAAEAPGRVRGGGAATSCGGRVGSTFTLAMSAAAEA